jgi:hypothetical protein
MLRGRGNGVRHRERGLLFRGMAIQRIGEITVWSSVFKSPDFGWLIVYVLQMTANGDPIIGVFALVIVYVQTDLVSLC